MSRRHVEIMRERAGDDFRLFVNLFRHEVAVIAFVDEMGGGERLDAFAFDRLIMGITKLGAMARQDREIAVFEIGQFIREGRER